jgi:hypothetical protein
MRRLVLMSGMVLGLIAACGGTTGSPLDNGGGGSGGSSDSGTKPGMDSGITSPDGAADSTSMSDTGSADTKPMDARRDTAPDAKKPFDAGCPSFCATHTPKTGTCNDFDESNAVPSDWTVVVNDGASVTVSEAEAFSCSNSLSAYLPMITTSTVMGASALAENAFKASGSTVTLDLEAYLPDNDMKSFVTYFALKLGNDPALGLQHHGDGNWYLGNSSTSFPINMALPMPPLVGAWNHMILAIDYTTSAGSATLTYAGSDSTPQSVMFSGVTETGAYPDGAAVVGMSAPFETEAAFTAYYDNVIVRIGM